MTQSPDSAILAFLETVHPYDSLPRDEMARVALSFSRRDYAAGDEVYQAGTPLPGLYIIKRGTVEVMDGSGGLVSILGPRNSFGERGLMRDGIAATTARATEPARLLLLPPEEFRRLIGAYPAFERFFNRSRGRAEARRHDLSLQKVGDLMARKPMVIAPDASIAEAAAMMRDAHVSSLGIEEAGRFLGIVTTRDMTNKVLAGGMDPAGPVGAGLTRGPVRPLAA